MVSGVPGARTMGLRGRQREVVMNVRMVRTIKTRLVILSAGETERDPKKRGFLLAEYTDVKLRRERCPRVDNEPTAESCCR